MGGATFQLLVERFGTAERALDEALSESARAGAWSAARSALRAAHAVGASLWLRGDRAYPATLLELPDPPPHLFGLGDVEVAAAPAVAIVGTRRATAYGERVTQELAGALARAGVAVVSGMARGIDAVAHRSALAAGGRTVAVLGTGVDVPYPAAHASLHAEIARRGLVLSEHPPGEKAGAGAFPRRNRIIAALASTTIVVEAGFKSGALITATHALDLGRTVAAVPGPIDASQSAGTNELLRDGAVVIASVADALALLGVAAPRQSRVPAAERDPDERALLAALAAGPLDLDALSARSRLPATRCLAAVTALELSGAVECALTGEIRRL